VVSELPKLRPVLIGWKFVAFDFLDYQTALLVDLDRDFPGIVDRPGSIVALVALAGFDFGSNFARRSGFRRYSSDSCCH